MLSPMSSAVVLRTVEAALGAPLTKLFALFEEAPLAAATSISISTPATALRSVRWRNL